MSGEARWLRRAVVTVKTLVALVLLLFLGTCGRAPKGEWPW